MIVGLDMGGTHIDGVIIEDGRIINKVKKPTNREDLFESIWAALKELLAGYDKAKIQRINLSTTVSTNAIIEGKTSSVGMIIQSGPGIRTDFLNCGDENIFISGYVDHRGQVVKDLDLNEIQEAGKLFKKKNIESCAVVSKFSTRNPKHEIQIKNSLEDDFPSLVMGHTLSGKLNFPRRVFTSYLNAAVDRTFKDFAANIKKSLEKERVKAPLFILKADGGTMNISTAEKRPVETILSGPAASFMGINAMHNISEDALLLDIGGTTTDIFFLADGQPLFQPLGIKIGPYKTLVRSIYSFSLGLGGDSSINIVDGNISIGPKRQGPPCAFGGSIPTPTDAMVTLGLLEEGDKSKAYAAMKVLGDELSLSAENTAELILDTMGNIIKYKVDKLLREINSQPVYTVRELLHGKIIDPKLIAIIGGPANILTPIIEKQFNLPSYYPRNYNIANAVGAALSKPTTEVTLLADTSKGMLSVPELGIYETIDKSYTLEAGRNRAIDLLKESALLIGAKEDEIQTEIVEESCFNMVKGFYNSGQDIRIKVQIKPGFITELRGVIND